MEWSRGKQPIRRKAIDSKQRSVSSRYVTCEQLQLNNMKSLLVLATVVAVAQASIIAEQFTGTQSYKVRGTLFCGDSPASNIKVLLVDDDFGPDPDDELDSGYTDGQGRFELAGDTMEGTTIDPHLKVYHDCNDGIRPCQRRWKFELPNKYITSGRNPKKVIDIGTWNLEAILPDEEHDCIH